MKLITGRFAAFLLMLFQGPEAFRAQLLEDMREMDAVKKKLGL